MQAAEARMRRALGLDGEQLRARPAPERIEPPGRTVERFVPGGHKRRFVHDGEVPVTVVHGLISGRREHGEGNGSRNGNHAPTNRLEIAEAALAAEIATRERTERALQEAQAAAHDLRTKLGHADLARQEAVEASRREREAAEALRAELQLAQAQIAIAQQAQEAAERALAELQEKMAAPVEVEIPVVAPEPEPATPARRGRKPRAKAAAAEPPAPVAKPRKVGRPRTKASAPARESKPIRWWLTPRKKRK
jgi:hypothetical protein